MTDKLLGEKYVEVIQCAKCGQTLKANGVSMEIDAHASYFCHSTQNITSTQGMKEESGCNGKDGCPLCSRKYGLRLDGRDIINGNRYENEAFRAGYIRANEHFEQILPDIISARDSLHLAQVRELREAMKVAPNLHGLSRDYISGLGYGIELIQAAFDHAANLKETKEEWPASNICYCTFTAQGRIECSTCRAANLNKKV